MAVSQAEDTLVSPPARRSGLSRRTLIGLGAAAIVVAAVGIAYGTGAFAGGSGTSGGASADNAFPTSLATVTRRSLTQQTQVSATLGYATASTIVAPAGTTPQDLAQAKQAAATAQAQLQTAQASLSVDLATQDQASASLSADRAKLTVDCGGDNAGESAASSSGAGAGSGAGSGACATDSQAVSTDEQSSSQADAKVASDRQAVSSATSGLATAETSLSEAEFVGDDLRGELDLHRAAGSRADRQAGTDAVRGQRRAGGAALRIDGAVAGVHGRNVTGQGRGGAEQEPACARLRLRSQRRCVRLGDGIGDRRVPGRPRVEPDRSSSCSARFCSSPGPCG